MPVENPGDEFLRQYVDEIWDEYDKDNSGALDREETKRFVTNMRYVINILPKGDEKGGVSEADFEACFKLVDTDGSGTIEKDEMAVFIKKYAGFVNESVSEPVEATGKEEPTSVLPND